MPFPTFERVSYKKNPLAQVICQLRYPAILRISAETPIEFQENIRKQYPLYKEKNELAATSIDVIAQLPPGASINAKPSTAYEFSSADKGWVLSLTKDFLALTAHNYERWEDFEDYIMPPFEVFTRVY
jgi:uncharacterized protein (TIGR04255 family)